MGIGKFGQDGDPGVPTPAPDPQAHDKLGNELLNMVNQPAPIPVPPPTPAAFVPPTETPDVLKKIEEFEAQQRAALGAAASATGTEAVAIPADQAQRDPTVPTFDPPPINTANILAGEAPPLTDAEIEALPPIARDAYERAMAISPYNDKSTNSDVGNAERFVASWRGQVMYCVEEAKWYVWNPAGVWVKDIDKLRVMNMAASMIMARKGTILKTVQLGGAPKSPIVLNPPEGINPMEAGPRILSLYKHLCKSLDKPRLENMVALARFHVSVRVDELNADKMLFNVKNGTLNLETGQLQEHDPYDFITKQADVVYDPTVTCPRWQQFLRESCEGTIERGDITVPKGAELEQFIQRAAGTSLTGDVSDKAMYLTYGGTDTGKTTLLAAIEDVLGPYAMHASFDTFVQKRSAGAATQGLAKLPGARFVLCEEVDLGKRMSPGIVKTLASGGGTVTARMQHGNDISFKPQLKLWLACNDRPGVDAEDDAMWRRMHIIPMDNHVPLERQDATLKDQFSTPQAKSAILNWLVAGVQAWRAGGLRPPACVQASADEYKDSQDRLRDFITDRCWVHPLAACTARDLFVGYQEWATGADSVGGAGNASDRVAREKMPYQRRMFSIRLLKRPGITKWRPYIDRKQGRGFKGIALLRPGSTAEEMIAEAVATASRTQS